MDDPLQQSRAKGRFVIEVRCEAIPRLLDNRGYVIQRLSSLVAPHFPHWRTSDGRVTFTDTAAPDDPTCELSISTKQITIILEDISGLPEFASVAEQYLSLAFDALQVQSLDVSRIGCRLISVHTSPIIADFERARLLVLDRFHKMPIELPFQYTDSAWSLVHDHGRFTVMPYQQSDDWGRQIFKSTRKQLPEFGIALDIDSFEKSRRIGSRRDLARASLAILDLSRATEIALANVLTAEDVKEG